MNLRRSGIWVSLSLLLAAAPFSAAFAGPQPAAGAGQPMDMQPAAPQPPAITERDVPGPPPIRPGSPISVIAFDFQNASMGAVGGEALAQYVLTQIKAGLVFSEQYYLTTYRPRLPLVRKAIEDGYITNEDLNALRDPATGELNLALALRMAYRMRVQAILVGTIEAVEVNRQANTATVTITVQLINSATGEVLRSAAVSGTAVGGPENSATELTLAAARDAATKALIEFGISLEEVGESVGVAEEGGGEDEEPENPILRELRRIPSSPEIGLIMWMAFVNYVVVQAGKR